MYDGSRFRENFINMLDSPTVTDPKHYKFNEDNTLEQVKRYIDKTYEQHYANDKYQATDMIVDAGHGEGFCMGNIMKYAMRYGKKPDPVTGDLRNQGDLLKIIHYAIIAIELWRHEEVHPND